MDGERIFFYNADTMTKQEPFYEKFIKKTPVAQNQRKAKQAKSHREGATEPPESYAGKRQHQSPVKAEAQAKSGQKKVYTKIKNSNAHNADILDSSVFSDLHSEAKRILEHFPDILTRILPLDAKKKQLLPQQIHALFHELTDERSSRKTHYLNNPVKLSAYTHYYVWWNLVRLTKLLQNLDISLKDGDYAADFGAGPLTFVCALWIAKPELRNKNITWYCVDISNKALSFGEELFLSLCAYTGQRTPGGARPWQIRKVCGAFGIPLNEKAALVTEANMFNELFWDNPFSLEEQTERTRRLIMQYLRPNGSVLLIEPGIPLAGEFLSMLRALFLEHGFSIQAPCPQAGSCCLPNRKTSGKSKNFPVAHNKWCHFTFETTDSPKNLLRLSDAAQLGKERASLSFLYCSAKPVSSHTNTTAHTTTYSDTAADNLPVRICSDIIMPEPHIIGRYACSALGFMFITSPSYKESVLNRAVSGSLLSLSKQTIDVRERDKKTGALLVRLS